jgi:hypothetical protein
VIVTQKKKKGLNNTLKSPPETGDHASSIEKMTLIGTLTVAFFLQVARIHQIVRLLYHY